MKKLFLILTVVLLLLSACKPTEQPVTKAPDTDLVVGDEDFEKILEKSTVIITTCGITYPDEQSYIDMSDIVIVGYPVNTFTDEPKQYYDRERNEVGPNGAWYTPDTIRQIKVLDVLKGENVPKTVNLQVTEVLVAKDDGTCAIEELGDTFIQKQNVKYIFYLKEWSTYNGEKTYRSVVSGGVNIDGLHQKSLSYVGNELFYNIINNRYDLFKKYNRSDEYYTSFSSENEAYAYSDLVVIGSPKNDIKDDLIFTDDGKQIDLNEAGNYLRGEVVTVRDIAVQKVLKGKDNLTDVNIATGHHYYYDVNSVQVEFWHSSEISNHDPIWQKDASYIFYLKRDEKLGENAYRISGTQCVLRLDKADDYLYLTSPRIYGMYARMF